MHEEPESQKKGGVFNVYGEPESPSEGAFKIYDEPVSSNEGAFFRFMMYRSHQIRGRRD